MNFRKYEKPIPVFIITTGQILNAVGVWEFEAAVGRMFWFEMENGIRYKQEYCYPFSPFYPNEEIKKI